MAKVGTRVQEPAFLLLLAVTATLFLRPAELFQALDGLPIYEALIGGCLLFSIPALQARCSWKTLKLQPVILCVLALLLAIGLSHASHAYIGGLVEAATSFGKVLVYFALLVVNLNSPPRLRAFLLTVTTCSVIAITMCVVDFHGLIDFQCVEHLADFDSVDDEGEVSHILRMRGLGIFQDPNDLAMLIVAAGVLCTYFLMDKSQGILRFAWIIPIITLWIGLFDTRSRGGLLAAGAAMMTLAVFWGGFKMAILCGVLGVCALAVMGGRQANLDLNDSTGGERVQLWRDGFDALKSSDILFGIGYGGYPDVAGLVAHNSFIHAYVELGIFGGTLFFGAFFFAFVQLYQMGFRSYPNFDREALRFRPYLGALLAGWCTSMLSLSRCYVVPTYMVLGLAAAYLHMAARSSARPAPLATWNMPQALRLTFASGALFVGLYLFTVMFA